MALLLIQVVTVMIPINFCGVPGGKSLSFSLETWISRDPGVRHSLLGTLL